MSFVFNQKGLEAEIILENGTRLLQSEEKKTIEYELNKQNIGFSCMEFRSGPQASLFNGIIVFINENLTSLLIGGLIMPGAYDTIKFALNKIANAIKNGPVRVVSPSKISIPPMVLKFSTSKGYIEAPIPENLTDTQFDKYMDRLNDAIQSLTEDKISEKRLIAEFDPDTGSVRIKTVYEYGMAQMEKQKNKY